MLPGLGVPIPPLHLQQLRRGDHTCSAPVVWGAAPGALGKGLSVLLASQSELLVPRRVDSVLSPLYCKKRSTRRGEGATPTHELRAESGRRSPRLGEGWGPPPLEYRGDPLTVGRAARPAARISDPLLSLLGRLPAGDRAENFCWDKRSLCLFSFFFSIEWDSVTHFSLLWVEDLLERLKP